MPGSGAVSASAGARPGASPGPANCALSKATLSAAGPSPAAGPAVAAAPGPGPGPGPGSSPRSVSTSSPCRPPDWRQDRQPSRPRYDIGRVIRDFGAALDHGRSIVNHSGAMVVMVNVDHAVPVMDHHAISALMDHHAISAFVDHHAISAFVDHHAVPALVDDDVAIINHHAIMPHDRRSADYHVRIIDHDATYGGLDDLSAPAPRRRERSSPTVSGEPARRGLDDRGRGNHHCRANHRRGLHDPGRRRFQGSYGPGRDGGGATTTGGATGRLTATGAALNSGSRCPWPSR